MLTYDLTKRNHQSKTYFLYESIKKDILTGRLLRNSRLPSKRELAKHLCLSIITVENAYQILQSEGYIVSRNRSGFFVADINFHQIFHRDYSAEDSFAHLKEDEFYDSPLPSCKDTIEGLAKVVRKTLTCHRDIFCRTSPVEGCTVLRNAIADYLLRFRSLRANPMNIIIGAGSEYLYRLCIMLLGQEKSVGIEYPSYEKIEQIYHSMRVKTLHLKMGNDGITKEALAECQADYLHVTPFHSQPTGVTAGAGKRYEYLDWAYRHKALIIEDDFDSETGFFFKPIDTLFQTDKQERIIYINTFTKSLSPGIRVAYMILPDFLLNLYRKKLGFLSCSVPVFWQYVLAAYIDEGYFERHLGRKRRQYLG
ncbi:MAG: PLP-dependent aminotransferase family protein [Succinivibrio sp.]|nr:PLP-dependent aminotransferase family protein [Succinivibrio sp.]